MNNTTAKLVVNELNKMSPVQIVEDERVEVKFIQLYNSIHGSQAGAMMYHKAKFDFMKLISDNQSLKECTPLSLYGCFLDAAVCGLSLEQGSKPHVYMIARSFNVGTRNNSAWEKRANLVVSPYGELVQRMRAGQIRHADNPVIVWEGDTFQPMVDGSGKKRVVYQALVPRKPGASIIGAFIMITRLDGTMDYSWLLPEDVERLRRYSEKQNTKRDDQGQIVSQKANALYTSYNNGIDPGFLEAKMIKHAFDAYPKVRTGDFTTLETEQVPRDQIDYGVEPESFSPVDEAPKSQPAPQVVVDNDDVF